MNATITTTGKAYTPDKDYAALSGRVVRRHVQKLGITQDGYVIGRVTRYIDIGRADGVTPRGSDVQLAAERLPRDPKADARTQAARVQAGERRHTAARENITAYLRAHGPQHFSKLLPLTDWTTYENLRQHFNANPDIYIRFGAPVGVWGLVGQDPPQEEKLPGLPRIAAVIRAALLQHGPHASRDLVALTGLRRNLIDKTIKRHPGVFVEAGKSGRSVAWDVRGQEAA